MIFALLGMVAGFIASALWHQRARIVNDHTACGVYVCPGAVALRLGNVTYPLNAQEATSLGVALQAAAIRSGEMAR